MWIDSERLNPKNTAEILSEADGILIPGGFGDRGIEGMIQAVKYARENHVPLFGICLGMQIMTIEFARSICGYADANSGEFSADSKHKVIDIMEEQKKIITKGGTMRLGAYPCVTAEDTVMRNSYQSQNISERHRHRYEFNNEYREEFLKKGLVISGISPDGTLVEAVELRNNAFFVGVQFHPEFKSRPNRPHPLFVSFLRAALREAK
jgi:CTP synthase